MLGMSRYDCGDNKSDYEYTTKVNDNFRARGSFDLLFWGFFSSENNGAARRYTLVAVK
tara:strand:- start:1531 stop:1704 length:174 start_codon:yes stop_codon:yes gene_type:complete